MQTMNSSSPTLTKQKIKFKFSLPNCLQLRQMLMTIHVRIFFFCFLPLCCNFSFQHYARTRISFESCNIRNLHACNERHTNKQYDKNRMIIIILGQRQLNSLDFIIARELSRHSRFSFTKYYARKSGMQGAREQQRGREKTCSAYISRFFVQSSLDDGLIDVALIRREVQRTIRVDEHDEQEETSRE